MSVRPHVFRSTRGWCVNHRYVPKSVVYPTWSDALRAACLVAWWENSAPLWPSSVDSGSFTNMSPLSFQVGFR